MHSQLNSHRTLSNPEFCVVGSEDSHFERRRLYLVLAAKCWRECLGHLSESMFRNRDAPDGVINASISECDGCFIEKISIKCHKYRGLSSYLNSILIPEP
jgi:hypothetical protein